MYAKITSRAHKAHGTRICSAEAYKSDRQYTIIAAAYSRAPCRTTTASFCLMFSSIVVVESLLCTYKMIFSVWVGLFIPKIINYCGQWVARGAWVDGWFVLCVMGAFILFCVRITKQRRRRRLRERDQSIYISIEKKKPLKTCLSKEPLCESIKKLTQPTYISALLSPIFLLLLSHIQFFCKYK